MPFCTVCGASVAGAFCSQCGTPAAASAGAAPPSAAPAPPPPARRGTSPFVWIVVIVLGLLALGFVRLIVGGISLVRRGPGYAIARIISAANPDAEVVQTDDGAGTVTIRSRRTGKTVTLSFDDARHGRFRFEADDDRGKHATVEVGGSAPLPEWVPSYPGSTPRPVFSARGESDNESGEAGTYLFTTSDEPSHVREFYEAEGRRLGMEVRSSSTHAHSSELVLKDPDEQRSLRIGTESLGGETTVHVTYGRKR
jgi:hypothetical protein